MVAMTEKVTFDICAELIAMEIKEIMNTIVKSKKAKTASVGPLTSPTIPPERQVQLQ